MKSGSPRQHALTRANGEIAATRTGPQWATVTLLLAAVMLSCGAEPPEPKWNFREQVLHDDFGVGYAVLIADVNGDDSPDIVAINGDQAVWFENPSWREHVISEGAATPDHVALAAHDIDRDGKLDLALGADWKPRNTEGAGTLQWIGQTGPTEATEATEGTETTESTEAADAPWELYPIGSEPTLHRLRWGDVDGDGQQELLVAPLHGRGTAPPNWWEGAGARLLVMRPPETPKTSPWPIEVADDTMHVMHNFWVTNFDDDPADEIITASYEGIHLLDRGGDGQWSRTQLGKGHQLGDADKGAGEVKLCRLADGKRYLATIEPWHANHLVIYEEPADPLLLWNRRVLVDKLNGGHALWCADLDGDGDEELIVGWRLEGSDDFQKPGVAVFDPGDWTYEIIDSGGMATEDIVAADLNGDGKPDIVAAGRSTHNVKIYWNER